MRMLSLHDYDIPSFTGIYELTRHLNAVAGRREGGKLSNAFARKNQIVGEEIKKKCENKKHQ